MDSHAIAALLRLQKPLALYQQQREAADAALRLAIEEAGFDPGVLEASVLDVPPMPLPLYDSGLSADADAPCTGCADKQASERERALFNIGLACTIAADLRAANRTIDNLRAEVAALKGERGEPIDANPWEGRG
jgi:8-oxo-dGTP pyrophosphatase MutT (NUDIX family)